MAAIANMEGKVALVTGAASGLGRATALKLGRTGARICIVDCNVEGLDETGAFLRADGMDILIHATDLTDPVSCATAVAAAHGHFGRLDALCNVAGVIFTANTPQMPVAEWNTLLAINLSAPFHLIQAAVPHLLDANGAVVNVASTAAFFGQAYAAAYCASKAGLLNMTKALAMEYMHKPIRFNAVAPGGMATNMIGSFKMPEGADMNLVLRYSGMRGLVEIDAVADMIAFLASPAAGDYHGACITIDKGITAG